MDEYARPSTALHALGLKLTHRIPPALKRGETLVTPYNLPDLPRMKFTTNGIDLEAAGTRQVLEGDPSTVIAKFQDGSPALFRITRGRGVVYWLASPLDPASWSRFLGMVAGESGLKPELQVTPVISVEYRVTTFNGRRIAYLYNDSDRDAALKLTPSFPFERIVDRRTEAPLTGRELALPARETASWSSAETAT